MKAVILAGGLGTRISEESHLRPKPMIEIGGKPILWHIMKIYSHYGVNDFVICLGYKGYMIKEFFANYVLHHADITVDVAKNSITFHEKTSEPWKVTLIDTGESTQTGGRLKRIAKYVEGEKAFHLTYGDGVADIDIAALTAFHKQHGLPATVTAVQPPGRFGSLGLQGDKVTSFAEKTKGDGGFINGGYFVLSPEVLSTISGDDTVWELEPLESLAANGKLAAFHHHGFWRPMDTLRDKNYLDTLCAQGQAPWKKWDK